MLIPVHVWQHENRPFNVKADRAAEEVNVIIIFFITKSFFTINLSRSSGYFKIFTTSGLSWSDEQSRSGDEAWGEIRTFWGKSFGKGTNLNDLISDNARRSSEKTPTSCRKVVDNRAEELADLGHNWRVFPVRQGCQSIFGGWYGIETLNAIENLGFLTQYYCFQRFFSVNIFWQNQIRRVGFEKFPFLRG